MQYLFRFTYTAAAWKFLTDNPEDRRESLATRIFSTFGGRLEGFWYSFGEQDGFALVELPDTVSVAAAHAAAASSGLYRTLETTPLVSVDEMIEAMDRASSFPQMTRAGWQADSD